MIVGIDGTLQRRTRNDGTPRIFSRMSIDERNTTPRKRSTKKL